MMLRRVIAVLLTVAVFLSFVSASYAVSFNAKNTDKAEKLKILGLFKGSSSGFDLDQKPTRAQGAVMLVRLLGKEAKAVSEKNKHPFADVPDWAESAVGYLYKNNLTKGMDEKTFGSEENMSALQYITFVLRALGYSDSKGDFKYDTCIDFAAKVDILNTSEASDIKGKADFLRDDIALISYNALKAKIKDTDKTLVQKLVEDKAITQESVNQAGIISNELPSKASTMQVSSSDQASMNYKNFSFANLHSGNVYLLNNQQFSKMKPDGSEKQNINGININKGFFVNGDYLYTLSICGGDIYKIVKYSLDGQLIKTFDDIVHEFYVDDNYIYFIKIPDPNNPDPSYSGQLFKMKTDGTDRKMLADVNTTSFAVIGDKIYFDGDGTAVKSDFEKFPWLMKDEYYSRELVKSDNYRIHGTYMLDMNTNKTTLIYPLFSLGFQEYNGHVYFLSLKGSTGSPNTLFRVKTGQTFVEELFSLPKVSGGCFFIVDNKVFYKTNATAGPKFYSKSLLNDNDAQTVTSVNFQYVNIIGDYFYFFNEGTVKYRLNYKSVNNSLETFTGSSWK